jgi:hypothetical protein
MSASAELINWVQSSNPPETDITVLLFDPYAPEAAWLGFHCEDGWRFVDGEVARPTFWAHMPKGPGHESH